MDLKSWLIGLSFSLLGGWLVTWLFLKVLRQWMGLSEKPKGPDKSEKKEPDGESAKPEIEKPEAKGELRGVPPALTGLIERLFFTVLVAFNVAGVVAAMVGWMALKLATNWNLKFWEQTPSARLFGFSALLAGLISMLFAFLGGLIVKRELWSHFVSCI
ncbi:hypothetical protein [Pseudomonas putida]|uniref:hypothetical protein n=1 Tax=Pseudomonas putida TaxID=303 RepID=UPI0023643914|nr:hypothetical protein [Pseudomonas putida]MDD2098944.1 hypothetical protein [Pseudomonas putida]